MKVQELCLEDDRGEDVKDTLRRTDKNKRQTWDQHLLFLQ